MSQAVNQKQFVCQACGNCCRVEGYVRLLPGEVVAMAELLQLSVEAFTDRYTRLTQDRRGLSLTEKDGHVCVFLEADGYCRVQAAKPAQCRDFPHKWSFFGYESICRGAQAST